MSDFLFSSVPQPPGLLRSHLCTYLDPVTDGYDEHHGGWGSLAVARAPHDRAVVAEDDRLITVVAGEPMVKLASGESGRSAVHERLGTGALDGWDDCLDGPFAALAVRKREGTGLVVTDLMAFVPLFAATPTGGTGVIVGTHVDAVARAAGRAREVDPVSAADLIGNMSISFPHTLYEGVEQVAPAAARPFEGGRGWSGAAHGYWRPVERTGFPTVRDAARALRESLVEDVRGACEGALEVGVLLSAGEDSRAVLGAVPEGVRARGFVFADWENREVKIARRVARAYGAELEFGRRGPDHYLRSIEPVASMVGSVQLFADVHGYGFHESLGIQSLPVVLGGFSSDSLLKGDYAPRDARGGRAAAGPRPRARLAGVREELLREAGARRRRWWERVRELRPDTPDEWYQLWPFSMRKHGANLHGNRRLFRIHEPFHSNALVKLAASVPLEWKLGRRLFHPAVRPLLARSWHVPHTKPRFPYFGSGANLPLAAGLAVARGLGVVLSGRIRANQGPWPKGRTLVGSELMGVKLDRYLGRSSPLRSLFSPGDTAVERRIREEWPPIPQLLLLQLAFLCARGEEG